MTEIFLCEGNVHARLDTLLKAKLKYPYEIKQTPLGKPYIGGNPLYISLTHSKSYGAIATDTVPVGVDLEIIRGRSHEVLIRRFPQREQTEINSERDFLIHWTARESYIKMRGETLASTFKRIEFFGGKIYLDGNGQPCSIRHFFLDGGRILCVCTREEL